jgi:LuxR family maltose regulon positive regulatory protein
MSSAHAPASLAIPQTKINPPNVTSTQILRQTICDQIATATAKLVLVRAPAGFGKTTAMAQSRERAEEHGVATAWLTLDRTDNDASRFARCLCEAVLRLGVEEPSDAAPLDPVAALAAYESPFALYLDDLEVVNEPAVLAMVRDIIEHLPRRGQLVIGSRSLPDLGVGRLRARGQLVEINAESLRFSVEETRAFFERRTSLNLPLEMLTKLHDRTEGWAAAICLVSMALERHGTDTGFIERFSGGDRAVAEYLAEDVLAHQPPNIREFLLRTSILRQLDASVCRALNPNLDCEEILDHLEKASLFLTPVAGEDRAWRYHSLFADFLRAQLERERPDELPRLHLAASGWYESRQRYVPAIDHAIEGGDQPLALMLLEGCAQGFLDQGRMRMLSRWFSAIPERLLRQHPRLQMTSLWAECFTHGPWEAMRRLEAADLAHSTSSEEHAAANGLYPLLLAMQDRYEEAFKAGRESLGRLPTENAFADSALLNAMANIFAVMGDPGESQRLLDAARGMQRSSVFSRMYTESLEGLLDLHAARLRQATARFSMAVDSTHALSYSHSHGNAWAGVLYAGVVYEANQLAQAERLLNVYLPLARDVGLPDHMILSHVMRSRIAFQHGDVHAAFQALTELEYLGHQRQLPRVTASAKLERSRVLLLQGNGVASRDELLRADDLSLWSRERHQCLPAHDLDYMALARARWEIAFGDARAARRTLDEELSIAQHAGRNRRALKLMLLRALALHRLGEAAAALHQIETVLRITSREGFMRLILDEGAAAAPLIHRFVLAQRDASPQQTDPILSEHLQHLLQALGPIPLDAEAQPLSIGGAESLTRKEIGVLKLLAEGYSNGAMAEKLFVSENTVRTHLRSINMKISAKSRTQAVAIARKLGVIL